MNRIKELRKSKNGGMTQQELAEAVSIPKRTIQRLENNESQIKPDKAQILADYFGVDVPYLLGYSDNPLGALDDLAKELDQHLSKAEKEDIKKHPELTQHYLALAWDRMCLNPEDIKPVKITPHNSALSDEELMKLPKEERQKYIKEQFKNLEVQIASLASLELHSLSAHYLLVRFANKRSCND